MGIYLAGEGYSWGLGFGNVELIGVVLYLLLINLFIHASVSLNCLVLINCVIVPMIIVLSTSSGRYGKIQSGLYLTNGDIKKLY